MCCLNVFTTFRLQFCKFSFALESYNFPVFTTYTHIYIYILPILLFHIKFHTFFIYFFFFWLQEWSCFGVKSVCVYARVNLTEYRHLRGIHKANGPNALIGLKMYMCTSRTSILWVQISRTNWVIETYVCMDVDWRLHKHKSMSMCLFPLQLLYVIVIVYKRLAQTNGSSKTKNVGKLSKVQRHSAILATCGQPTIQLN